MNEQDLIQKIQTLKDIKPRKDWLVLSKSRILEKSFEADKIGVRGYIEFFKFLFSHKYAFSSLVALMLVIGLFGFAQKATPGDALYTLKKTLEQTQLSLLSENQKSKYVIDQANTRLEELSKVAQANNSKKLAPAINEYKASVSEVAKTLAGENNSKNIKELASGMAKLSDKEKEIKSLGIEIEENVELDTAVIQAIMKEVDNLKDKELNEKQKELLRFAEVDARNKDFANALDKITSIPENQ